MKTIFAFILMLSLSPSLTFADTTAILKSIKIERIVQIDQVIVGITRDLHTVAFNCDRSFFGNKGSVGIVENSDQEITLSESSKDGIRFNAAPGNLSKSFRLSKNAEATICGVTNDLPILLKIENNIADIEI